MCVKLVYQQSGASGKYMLNHPSFIPLSDICTSWEKITSFQNPLHVFQLDSISVSPGLGLDKNHPPSPPPIFYISIVTMSTLVLYLDTTLID